MIRLLICGDGGQQVRKPESHCRRPRFLQDAELAGCGNAGSVNHCGCGRNKSTVLGQTPKSSNFLTLASLQVRTPDAYPVRTFALSEFARFVSGESPAGLARSILFTASKPEWMRSRGRRRQSLIHGGMASLDHLSCQRHFAHQHHQHPQQE